jgi:hypothetical protein
VHMSRLFSAPRFVSLCLASPSLQASDIVHRPAASAIFHFSWLLHNNAIQSRSKQSYLLASLYPTYHQYYHVANRTTLQHHKRNLIKQIIFYCIAF